VFPALLENHGASRRFGKLSSEEGQKRPHTSRDHTKRLLRGEGGKFLVRTIRPITTAVSKTNKDDREGGDRVGRPVENLLVRGKEGLTSFPSTSPVIQGVNRGGCNKGEGENRNSGSQWKDRRRNSFWGCVTPAMKGLSKHREKRKAISAKGKKKRDTVSRRKTGDGNLRNASKKAAHIEGKVYRGKKKRNKTKRELPLRKT